MGAERGDWKQSSSRRVTCQVMLMLTKRFFYEFQTFQAVLHTIHVQDAISSNDLLLCEGAAPVLFEETHHLILARPLHVLVLGVVHQAAGDAGKVGLELEQA